MNLCRVADAETERAMQVSKRSKIALGVSGAIAAIIVGVILWTSTRAEPKRSPDSRSNWSDSDTKIIDTLHDKYDAYLKKNRN